MKKKRVTIEAIAAETGFSTRTVWLALRGQPGVAPETAEEILQAAERLGYRRHHDLPRRLGLVTPRVGHSSYVDFLHTIQIEAGFKGYVLDVRHTDGSPPGEAALVAELDRERIAGLVLLGPATPHAQLGEWARSRPERPLIAINVEARLTPQPPNLLYLAVDNEMGVREAVAHLVELGHERIAYIAGRGGSRSNVARQRAYEAALAERSLLDLDRRYIVPAASAAPADFGVGYEACRRLLATGGPRPTAIVAYADVVAVGALRAAADLGLTVPDDVSIVGIDDVALADFSIPRLTTVVIPRKRQAELTVQALVDFLESGSADAPPEGFLLGTHLIVRESTGAVPAPR